MPCSGDKTHRGEKDDLGRRLISFDWALKRLLRQKANFEILEGFLSELLAVDVKIIEVLESESNKDTAADKFNRVDLKVRLQTDEIVIIEVQVERQYDFLQRMLFAASRVVTEHMRQSAPYSEVVKVYSVNILYFDLGRGRDYVYRGRVSFKGLHLGDELELTDRQRRALKRRGVWDVFPEYYFT